MKKSSHLLQKSIKNPFSRAMPRTALRYAIEHYSPEERKAWLRA